MREKKDDTSMSKGEITKMEKHRHNNHARKIRQRERVQSDYRLHEKFKKREIKTEKKKIYRVL